MEEKSPRYDLIENVESHSDKLWIARRDDETKRLVFLRLAQNDDDKEQLAEVFEIFKLIGVHPNIVEMVE